MGYFILHSMTLKAFYNTCYWDNRLLRMDIAVIITYQSCCIAGLSILTECFFLAPTTFHATHLNERALSAQVLCSGISYFL